MATTAQSQDTALSQFNATAFLVSQFLAKVNTATVVKVVAVTNAGTVSPVGFVDVVPQVNQMTANNLAVPHGTIYNLPYLRIQGGTNAIIIDPQIGDLGVAVFADRDISSVVAAKGQANPGSLRRHDMADGMYLGGILNAEPEQYIQFNGSGIALVSPSLIKLQAPNVEIDASSGVTVTTPTAAFSADITAAGTITGDVDVIAGTISGKTHVHTSSLPGNPTSAPL